MDPVNHIPKASFFRRIFSSKRPPPPAFVSSPSVPSAGPLTAPNPVRPTGEITAHVHGSVQSIEHPSQSSLSGGRAPAQLNPEALQVAKIDGVHDSLTPPTSGGFFANAQNVSINDSKLYEVHGNQTNHFNTQKTVNKTFNDPVFIENFTQNIDMGGTVLLILDKKRVPGAEFDSSERDPPPQCHPETRKELREFLSAWLIDPLRHSTFIWLSGPAGVGKSAVAQTFAEHCQDVGRLGASFFFSRLNHRDGHIGVLPTIAFQLAVNHAGYNHLITRTLARDPSILDKTLRVQFRRLIIEPFDVLSSQGHITPDKPLVIIIDGLDECSSEQAQREFVKLIGDYTSLSGTTRSPVLWLLCSRPEWHIQQSFSLNDPPIQFIHEELTCDAEKDIQDVYLILKDGLQAVRDRTSWASSASSPRPPWPKESQLQQLSRIVNGLPVLATTVIRFIGDGSSSPDSQLKICLLSLANVGTSSLSESNPLIGLDAFYKQIMSRIPPSVLPTTKQILEFWTLVSTSSNAGRWKGYFWCVGEVMTFLCLDEDTFYGALRHLHSVLNVPSSDAARTRGSITFFHKSFIDFLHDPHRSGTFALDMDRARYDLGVFSLWWSDQTTGNNECRLPKADCDCQGDPTSRIQMKWDDLMEEQGPGGIVSIRNFLKFNFWENLCVDDTRRHEMLEQLRTYSFCHLPQDYPNAQWDIGFGKFIAWLLETPDDPKVKALLRVKPNPGIDETLFERYGHSSLMKESILELAEYSMDHCIFLSLHQRPFQEPDYEEERFRAVFWIGEGKHTAQVFLRKVRW